MQSSEWPSIAFDVVSDCRPRAANTKRNRCPQLNRKQRRAAERKQPKKPTNVCCVHSALTTKVSLSAVNYELSGYMPKRHEFECEWDDDCERKIMDIEFNDDDTPEEFELKMQLLEVYNERLAKRHAVRKCVL